MSRNSGSSLQLQRCTGCNSIDSVFARLQCHHPFCLVCLSYLYIKSQPNSGSNGNQVACSECDRITRLDIHSVEAIQATIEGTVLPGLNMLGGSTLREQHKDAIAASKRQAASEKQLRSSTQKILKRPSDGTTLEDQEPAHSAHNFFVDSPKESIVLPSQQFCRIHSFEEVSFVCLTCQEFSLCQKCIQSKHKQHQVQAFSQAVESVTEWLSERKRENEQRILFCESRQRKVSERKHMMHSKWEKVKEHIVDSFEQLRLKLKKRETELLEHCDEHYRSLEQSLERELDRVSRNLQSLKNHKTDLRRLSTHELFASDKKLKTTRTVEFFRVYHLLQEKMASEPIRIILHEKQQLNFLSLNEAEVVSVGDAIQSLELAAVHAEPDTIRMLIPDKYTSLNSSRERTKRILKTEEDLSSMLSKRNTQQPLQTNERMSHKKAFSKANFASNISRFSDKQTIYGQKVHANDSESIYSSVARNKAISTKFLSKTNTEVFGQLKSKKQLNLTKERIDYRTVTEQAMVSPQYESKRKRVG